MCVFVAVAVWVGVPKRQTRAIVRCVRERFSLQVLMYLRVCGPCVHTHACLCTHSKPRPPSCTTRRTHTHTRAYRYCVMHTNKTGVEWACHPVVARTVLVLVLTQVQVLHFHPR